MLERTDGTANSLCPASLLGALRERTRNLHMLAERSGMIADILQGRATREGYALLLRNLLPVYQTLEQQLARHVGTQPVGPVVRPELEREPDRRPLDFRLIRRLLTYTRPYTAKRNWLLFAVVVRAIQLPCVAWVIGAVINGPIAHDAPLSSVADANVILRPASGCAIASSHAFCCSN